LTLGVRGKLFLISVLLILSVGLAAGAYLEIELRRATQERLTRDLALHAEAARVLIETIPVIDSIDDVDPLADRLGAAVATRVTVIASDGTVLGDSAVALSEVAAMDNHLDRPEVQDAIATGQGGSRRHSASTDQDLLYLAVRYRRDDGWGVVRLATPLREVEEVLARSRLLLGVSGLIGLALAIFMSGLASHVVSRQLRRFVKSAQTIATQRSGHRIHVRSEDEIGGLAGSFNRLAQQLEDTLTELANERNKFETVLESMNEAVIALDEHGRVTLVNRAAAAMLGPARRLPGRTLLETLRIPALQELVVKCRQEGPASAEIELPGPPVQRVWIHARPHGEDDHGVVLVLHDVSDIRRLETMRRDFVANVSHELRTPISVIRANAETLLEGALEQPDIARRFVEALVRNADRLSTLVNELLDIARIEAGKYTLEPTSFPLTDAIDKVLEIAEVRAKERGTTISVDVAEHVHVSADSKALEQVVLNLLDNAIKYAPAGSLVEVVARATNEHVRVEIRDRGPGIDPMHRDRVFERFYRVDAGRARDMGGTGLGLAIVKHLIDAMGGRVGIEPRSPHGAVFWFTLKRSSPL